MPKNVSRSAKRVSGKQKSQLSGSFHLKARREKIHPSRGLGLGEAACPGCGAVYFDKHWHSCSEPSCRLKSAALPKRVCPECRMTEHSAGGAYAGEVMIEGVSDPAELKEIKNLALNAAKRAAKRDPEDRVVKVIDGPGSLDIYTSENQLAVAIGKQIHQARKGGELTITWSKTDKPVRVRWQAGQ